MKRVLLLAAGLLVGATTALARTIVLTAANCRDMAALTEAAPRQGWAAADVSEGTFSSGAILLTEGHSFLIRFPLDAIPADCRVVHAELTLPVTTSTGPDPRFYCWRVLGDWGPGVCQLYRRARPERVPWTAPGARAISSDRATRPTDVISTADKTEVVINVTEDVELWQSGSATNGGWLLSVEDPGVTVNLYPPLWAGLERWMLRVTFEPK